MEDNENPLKNWHPQEVIAHTQEQLELSGINTKMGSICKRKGTAFSAGILFFLCLIAGVYRHWLQLLGNGRLGAISSSRVQHNESYKGRKQKLWTF